MTIHYTNSICHFAFIPLSNGNINAIDCYAKMWVLANIKVKKYLLYSYSRHDVLQHEIQTHADNR